MECLDADTVLAWIDGQLSTQRGASVEAHIDTCVACRRVVSETAATADEPPENAEQPKRLGPYEIRALVGRGGMGEVYRAYDPRLDREVAVKIIRLHGRRMLRGEDLDWFERETRAAAAISHANVLAVFDVGRHEGVPYVVTELLDGESLRTRLKRGPIGPRQAIPWARDLAHGMAAAHDRGIVHRDIKPDNVFITSEGRVKILDFGVATFLAGRDDADARGFDKIDEPGLVVGTLGYMAPEQLRGDKVDHRTDVFAFGAVMYEMLTGEAAFRGGGELEIAESALGDDPIERSPDTLTKVPWPIVQVVRRCLEKTPGARFQSARDLAFALDMLGADSSRAVATPGTRRWPWLIAAVAVVAAVIAIAWPRGSADVGIVAPPSPRVTPIATRLLHRGNQIGGARVAGDTVYASVAFDAGVGLAGFASLRIGTLGKDGAFDALPETSGMRIAAIRGDDLLVLRDLMWNQGTLYGRVASVNRKTGQARPLDTSTESDVITADFRPDGSIAVVRSRGGQAQIESPIGTIVHGPTQAGLSSLRVSPTGAIAFIEATTTDVVITTTTLKTIRDGRTTPVAGPWREVTSVAWAGDDLLVAGSRDGATHVLWHVGAETTVRWSSSRPLLVYDVTPNGAAIVADVSYHERVFARRPGWTHDREMSSSYRSALGDLSADGRWLSMMDRRGAMDEQPYVVVRALDGGDPIDIGRGIGGAIDPTGTRVLSRTPKAPWKIVETTLTPDPGKPPKQSVRTLPPGPLENFLRAGYLDDGRIAIIGATRSSIELYMQDPAGGLERRGIWPILWTSISKFRISPDGKQLFDADSEHHPALFDLQTLAIRRVKASGVPAGWSSKGDAIFLVDMRTWPLQVLSQQLDGSDSKKLFAIAPPGPGVLAAQEVRVARDGVTYAYSVSELHTDLVRLDHAVPREGR